MQRPGLPYGSSFGNTSSEEDLSTGRRASHFPPQQGQHSVPNSSSPHPQQQNEYGFQAGQNRERAQVSRPIHQDFNNPVYNFSHGLQSAQSMQQAFDPQQLSHQAFNNQWFGSNHGLQSAQSMQQAFDPRHYQYMRAQQHIQPGDVLHAGYHGYGSHPVQSSESAFTSQHNHRDPYQALQSGQRVTDARLDNYRPASNVRNPFNLPQLEDPSVNIQQQQPHPYGSSDLASYLHIAHDTRNIRGQTMNPRDLHASPDMQTSHMQFPRSTYGGAASSPSHHQLNANAPVFQSSRPPSQAAHNRAYVQYGADGSSSQQRLAANAFRGHNQALVSHLQSVQSRDLSQESIQRDWFGRPAVDDDDDDDYCDDEIEEEDPDEAMDWSPAAQSEAEEGGSQGASDEDDDDAINDDDQDAEGRYTRYNSILHRAPSSRVALPNVDISAYELLCYFPQHTRWPAAWMRLLGNGWATMDVCNAINFARGCRRRVEANKRHDAARHQITLAGRAFFDIHRWTRVKFPSTLVSRNLPNPSRWQPPASFRNAVLRNVLLADLAQGVVYHPQGRDRGVLTQAIQQAVQQQRQWRVNDLPRVVRSLGLVNPAEAADCVQWDVNGRARFLQRLNRAGGIV